MEFIKPDTRIDFVKYTRIAVIASLVMIAMGVASLLYHGGPRLGIDFAGGALIQVKFDKATSAADIRSALAIVGMEGSLIQQFGGVHDNEYLIRTDVSTSDLQDLDEKVATALMERYEAEHFEIRRVEVVGAAVGKDLRQKGILSIFYAMIGILIYVSLRFEFRYAPGAIIALAHDVLITVGIFSLLGKEFTLPVIAALLAVIGYSLNDTIVVFDRIRENVKGLGRKTIREIINISINQTLTRTLITAFTTLLVLVALLILGGPVIHDFAFALTVGVIVGTYSSIFIASQTVLAWERWLPSSNEKKRNR